MSEVGEAGTVAIESAEDGPRVGVALSGGGHRAACWGAGALLGLAAAGLNRDVVSVASVSGGSLANGATLVGPVGYETMSAEELEKSLSPWLGVWAKTGLFFEGPATDRYVAGVFTAGVLALAVSVGALVAAAAAGRDLDPLWSIAGAMLLAAVFALLVRAKTKNMARLPTRSKRRLIVAAGVGGAATGAALWTATSVRGLAALGVAVAWLVTAGVLWRRAIGWFGERSEVVDRALGASLLAGPTGPLPLAGFNDRRVHHVFCSANLTTGDHFYLTSKLASGFGVGAGSLHPAVTVATAVQCSACLPGAFVARPFAAAELFAERPERPAEPVRLSDGGVYDNMADQWEFGFAKRAVRLAGERPAVDLAALQAPAEVLVVVNASGAMSAEPAASPWARGRRKAIGEEIASLAGAKDVIYDVSTSIRRAFLVASFGAAGGGLRGALVHITQSPYRVPSEFGGADAPSPDDSAATVRAREAVAFLDRLGQVDGYGQTPAEARAWWAGYARGNAGVPTTLGAIGTEPAARLLHQAFTLTLINLFVICGLGALPASDVGDQALLAGWGRARFDRLVAAAAPPG